MKFKLHAGFLIATLWCTHAALAAKAPVQHLVKIDDHPIAVWSRAPANPRHVILLLHGRTWSALPDFDLQTPEHRSVMQALMDRGFATYAVDLRGYGSTPRNADGWNTPSQAATDVARVLQWLAQRHPRLSKPALLGWSNGALISHLTAQQHPELLSDLILYGYPRDPGTTPAISPVPQTPPHAVNTRENAISDFISPNVTSRALIDAYAIAALKADPVRADWRQLEEYLVLDPTQVKNPTLLIHGERDPFAPLAAQSREFVALGNPDKQWIVLAGGDHAAMLEDTHEAFIAAITAFVERPRVRLRTR